jgi:hypothetical protein
MQQGFTSKDSLVPSWLSWPRTDVNFIPAETPSHRPCSYLHFHVPLTQLCNIHKFVQCLISCLFHLTFSAISFLLTSFSSWTKFPTQLLLRIITATYFHLQVNGWPCVNFFQRIRIIKAHIFYCCTSVYEHHYKIFYIKIAIFLLFQLFYYWAVHSF